MKPAAWVATAAAVDAPTCTLMPQAHYTVASQFTGLADLLILLKRHNDGQEPGQRDATVANLAYPSAPALAAQLGLPAAPAARSPEQKAQLAQAIRAAKVRVADVVLNCIVAPEGLAEVRHRAAVDDHRTRPVLLGVRTDTRAGASLRSSARAYTLALTSR